MLHAVYVVCWSICPWWLSLVKGRRRRPMSAVKESRHFHLRCRCSEPAHLYWHYRHLVSVCFAHRISNCLLISFTSKAAVTQSCQYVCHSAYHSDCLSARLLQKSGWPLSWKTWKIRELDSGQGKVRESYNHHLAAAREKDHIISGFGIYGAAVVPDSGVGY